MHGETLKLEEYYLICLHSLFFFIAILLLYGKFYNLPGSDTA